MLYKIRCNPCHTLHGALPVRYVPVRVACGAVIAHRYTYTPPGCRTYSRTFSRTFIPMSVSLWNDLSDSVFDGVEKAGLKSRVNAFLSTFVFVFPFPSFILWIGYCGTGVFELIGCYSLSPSLALPTFFNNNNNSSVSCQY